MSNKDTIRIGIVGAGGNTRNRHIPEFRKIPGVVIEAVVNRTRESSQLAAEELKIPRTYGTWKDLVSDPDIDAVMIGTWPYMHCPVTTAALEHGKHVLCEARMAMNSREAQQMVETARRHPELTAQIVPSPFTLSVDKKAEQLIRDGYLGTILFAEIEHTHAALLDRSQPLTWRQDRNYSGNNVLSVGIWYEILNRWLGTARTVRAQAMTLHPMRPHFETGVVSPVRIPDHIDIIAELACGAQARMRFSSIMPGKNSNKITICGTKGYLQYDCNEGKLYGAGQEESGPTSARGIDELKEIRVHPDEGTGWRVEEEFINAIRGNEAITCTTFEDGLSYMQFTDAVWESIEACCKIYLR
jgi:predicted dehydrogenase